MAVKKSPEEKAAAARSASAKKGAKTRSQNKTVATAQEARSTWEAENPQRFTPLHDLHHDSLVNDPEFHSEMKRLGRDPVAEAAASRRVVEKMGTRQFYGAMGYSQTDRESTEESNNPGQGTLFANPNTVENPTPWEDMSEAQRERARGSLAEHGMTEEDAARAIGARMDKAFVSEKGMHGNFYSTEGESVTGAKMPRQVLQDSRSARGISMGHAAMVNSQTSPESKFVGKSAEGAIVYPNNESGMYSADWATHGRASADAARDTARSGGSPEAVREALHAHSTGPGMTGQDYEKHPDFYVPREDKVTTASGNVVKRKDDPRAYPVQGYPVNNRKAIDSTRSLLGLGDEGPTSLSEAYGSAGQKVGPFHNAWAAPHSPEGNFSVLDTHAAEGLAPHLSKDEQTKMVDRVGVKALNDHLMRQEMTKRGLSSVNRAQSAMWRSTKEDEGHADDVAELTPRRHNVGQQLEQVAGQQELKF